MQLWSSSLIKIRLFEKGVVTTFHSSYPVRMTGYVCIPQALHKNRMMYFVLFKSLEMAQLKPKTSESNIVVALFVLRRTEEHCCQHPLLDFSSYRIHQSLMGLNYKYSLNLSFSYTGSILHDQHILALP